MTATAQNTDLSLCSMRWWEYSADLGEDSCVSVSKSMLDTLKLVQDRFVSICAEAFGPAVRKFHGFYHTYFTALGIGGQSCDGPEYKFTVFSSRLVPSWTAIM